MEPATSTKVAGGIPQFRFVAASEFSDGMLAAWQPNDPIYPEGAVLINAEHPVLAQAITYWQDQYADNHADEVRNEVLKAYGEVAVAKVAHSEWLKSEMPRQVVETEL